MSSSIRASRRTSVIDTADPIASRLFAGLPYTQQDSGTVEGQSPAVGLTCRLSGDGGLSGAIDQGEGRIPLGIEVAPLIPRHELHVQERPFPVPAGVLGVISVRRAGPEVDKVVAELESEGATKIVNIGPGIRGIDSITAISDHLDAEGPYRNLLMNQDRIEDSVLTATTVLHASALACPVVLIGQDPLGCLIGSDIEALARQDVSEYGPIDWMRLAADQKTAAWVDHRAHIVWDVTDLGGRPALKRAPLPTLSVILSTIRPHLLDSALNAVARQRDARTEVAVAIHGGDGQAIEEARSLIRDLGLDGTVISAPTEVSLGVVLNDLVDRTSGEYVTKWDDDDLYGPDHVRDLMAAHFHSGAALVGKAPEFTYFEPEDVTVWRNPWKAEASSLVMAGGTILIQRSALNSVGRFAPARRAIDHFLKTECVESGLGVFRTHGFGFALVRHEDGHTWEMDEEAYRQGATTNWVGLPEVIGL